jgi:hypothetical protein
MGGELGHLQMVQEAIREKACSSTGSTEHGCIRVLCMLCLAHTVAVLRAHLLHRFPSSFQEGCPLCWYAIYDTKASLCYKWTLLCYDTVQWPLWPSRTYWVSQADTQLRCVGTVCSDLAIPRPCFYTKGVRRLWRGSRCNTTRVLLVADPSCCVRGYYCSM